MTSGEKRRAKLSHFLLPLAGLIAITLFAPVSISAQVERDQCAGINKDISRQSLEAVIEKYRRGESVADGQFYCRKAFPTIVKYALDPDPKVRERMTFFLSQHYSREALQALVRQIETYPDDTSAFPYAHAARYPCYFFKRIKLSSLAQSLSARIKAKDEDYNGNEIRLLGCLSPRDAQARQFLEEMSRPSFRTRLSENDRQDQLNTVTYALAEAGVKEAEEKVLADIEAASAADNHGAIQSALDKVKGFTNCRIIQRLAQLILDKRAVTLDVYDDGKIKQVQGRVSDMAISAFTGALGTQVTGEKDVELKPHADSEIERIYQRVKKALEGGKYSTCRSSK